MTSCRIVEDVQIVFAVAGGDSSLELQIRDIAFKRLVDAGLQVVSIRKDQAVVFGEKDASVGDRIKPTGGLGFLVEHEVPVIVLFERLNLQQNNIANDRVIVLTVVERLIRVVDWFVVDA